MNNARKTLLTWFAVSAYAIVAIFTFTYKYQRVRVSPNFLAAEVEQRSGPALFAGVFWPVYWTGFWAYRWTAPADPVADA